MAAGDVKWNEETTITWANTGGDEQLDLGTANGNADAVCVGSYHDFGTGARSFDYRLDIFIDGFDTAPVIGEQNDVYISEGSSTTVFSGPESPNDTTSGAGNTNRLPNILGPFPVTVHSTTAADNLVASYEFRSSSRYLAPVNHNNTADKLLSTADAHTIKITPLFPSVAQS